MFRIAMKAPIIAANTAIQTVTLARSGLEGTGAATARGVSALVRASVDIASPLRVGISDPRPDSRLVGRGRNGRILARERFDGGDDGHARAQLDRGAAFER